MKHHLLIFLALIPCLSGADLRRAEGHLKVGQYLFANQAFREVLIREPENDSAAIGLSRTQIAMGRCELGYPSLKALKGSIAWSHKASHVEGICLTRSGDLSGAVASFEESIAASVDYPVAWFGLHQAQVQQGAMKEASETLNHLSQMRAGEVFTQTAQLFFEQRFSPLGYEFRVLQGEMIPPELKKPALVRQHLLHHARLWLNAGHPHEAVRILRPVWMVNKTNIQLSALLAEAYRRTGYPEDAEAVFEHSLVQLAQHPIILGVRARVAHDLGHSDVVNEALGVLAHYEHEERYATQWYISRDIETPQKGKLAQKWAELAWSRDVTLEQYIPWSADR